MSGAYSPGVWKLGLKTPWCRPLGRKQKFLLDTIYLHFKIDMNIAAHFYRYRR